MIISKKRFKVKITKVYQHDKKEGRIAIRLVGKYLHMFGFENGDDVLVKMTDDRIVLKRMVTLHKN